MTTDLLVLGAGPAGAAISLLMAAKGYSVEILDAAFFPRPKICGEFLNPQAVQWLRENQLLGFVEETSPYPIYGMKITDHHRRSFSGTYQQGQGYAIQRKDFDAILVSVIRQQGIQLYEGFRAERLLIEDDRALGVRGTDSAGNVVEKRARILIGADGRNNLIGRTFGWMKTIRKLRKYAFLSYFDDVADLQNYGEIHLVNDGYIGVAPLTKNLANVALVVDETACPPGTADLQRFLLQHVQKTQLAERLRNPNPLVPVITAGPLAYTLKKTSGHRTLLVGDTCGFIDPFTGEGINYAFISATIASDILDRCLRSNRFDDSALAEYDQIREQTLSRKLRMAKLLQNVIHSHGLSDFLVDRFASNQQLADTMVSAVGGAIPVGRVWNFRFVLEVLFGHSQRQVKPVKKGAMNRSPIN
jgi:menaquinone-9 beta-reductase